MASVILVVIAALWPACRDEPEPEPGECSFFGRDVQTGELFDIYAYGHDFTLFCSGGLELAEEHAQWVAAAWGEVPREFDYLLFESRQDPCWPCNPAHAGCASSEAMAATDLPHRHEITHAVRGYPCPPLLEEGWAILFGDPFLDAGTEGDLRQAADSLQPGYLAGEFYPIAARFVAFLLETRGLDGLKALCELPIKDSASLDAALMQVFDQSLDEISAEFADYPAWSLAQLLQDQACEGEEVSSVPGNWNIDLGCGAPGVEGRQGGQVIAHRLIDVPETRSYRLRFEAAVDFHFRMELRNCTRDGMASVFYRPYQVYGSDGERELVILNLPAGKYVVRLRLEEPTDPILVEMAMGPWP